MPGGTCQIADARKRVLGPERPGDPSYPPECGGDTEWHNFPTLDSGDPIPFFLCEAHRVYLRSARLARSGRS
jgi:hypothetical protein